MKRMKELYWRKYKVWRNTFNLLVPEIWKSLHKGKQKLSDAPPTPQRTQMWAQVAAEEKGVEARSLAHNTWGVEGRVGAPGWD
jgi:hypothetical protein